MTSRRELMKLLAGVVALRWLPEPDGYQSVGYLAPPMPMARLVTSVTLDGVEQFPHKVLRGDDRAGWIEVLPRAADGRIYPDPLTGSLRKEIRRGVVRFSFRDERPPS
jgi:hypothetical protein